LRAVFEAPTAAELAARVAAERPAAEFDRTPIVPVPREGALPLSFAQQRLWFLDQWEPGSPLYNMPAAVELKGQLDRAALAAALGEIVRRHEALRTTFRIDTGETAGEPVQVIAPPSLFHLPLVDLRGLPGRQAEADRLAAAEARRPFDLGRGPLLRASLLRLEDEEHVALVTLHHIVSDGWSTGLMVRELGALYAAFVAGAPSPLPEPAVQYADFAAWQRRRLSGDFLTAELVWWRGQLAGMPPALELPVDRRPAVSGTRGAVHDFAIPERDLAALHRLARRQGTTLFMALLAGFAALLRRYTGEDDLAVGTPIAGRTRVETEPLIGLFVNTLVLRMELAGDPEFTDLLERARETTLAAYAHQEVPFERLVEELAPERDLSRPPLVQVLLVLQNAPADDLRLPGLALHAEPLETGTAKLEMAWVLTETERGIEGRIEYNRDLFERSTVERMAGHFSRLLSGAAAEPRQPLSELPLLSGAEREELLGWRRSPGEWALPGTAQGLFEERARLRPEAVALVAGGRRMTYGELARRSGSLAAALRRLGVGPEVRVGLSSQRSFELVVGILGILRSGGALVPLDPAHPAERLALLLEDSGLAVVVSQEDLPVSGPANLLLGEVEDADWTGFEIPEEALAYVIYTSGSTGRPKGVGVTHANLVPMLLWSRSTFDLKEGRRVLQSLSYAFDFGLWEILTAVTSGAALHVPPVEETGDAEAFARRALAAGIDTVHATPSFARAVAETGTRLEGLRVLHLGGEALSRSGVERLAAAVGAGCALYNGYGPTEVTVNSLLFEIGRPGHLRGGERTPIGRPSAENAAYVVDRWGGLAPVGVPGELWVSGPGVARGYLGRPELTAEKFIPDVFGSEPGARLYRTGDLARWLIDGTVELLGRLDFQVKVRGYRIEPGEVEAALRRHPAVHEAVVMARGERLVAWVVADAEGPELQAFLGGLLPAALVPSAIVRLDGLPLTPTGKVDRRALPEPDFTVEEEPAAPRTSHEELVARIFAEVLGAERVGPSSDFFLLGGHSLLATRVVSRLRAALGVELPVRALFEAPTVAELASRIAAELPEEAAAPLVPVARPEPLPLSFAQERLWFLDQLEGGGPLYNVPVAWRLRGPLDAGRLAAALRGVAARHESLRTTFPAVDGRPVQAVAAEPALELERVELDELSEAVALARLEEEVKRPFDLARGPLGRALLIRLGEDDHLLALTLHHVVADGGSMAVLFRELAALYAGETLPELPVQYPDYAVWQRGWLQGEVLDAQLAFWRGEFPTPPQPLDLPTDRPRPATQTFRGGAVPVELPAELVGGLRDLARQRGATAFMTLLAAWGAVLHRWSGQEDFALGTPAANRRPEVEGLIGFFVNLLPLRVEPAAGRPFAGLLDGVRARALAAYAHQDVPFERLVDELAPGRDLSRAPVCQAVLALEDGPAARLRLPGVAAEPVAVHTGTAKLELVLALAGNGGALSGGLEYNADLFDAATAGRMAGHLATLLTGAVADPESEIADLPLLTAAESRQILADWTATAAPFARGRGLHELFEEQVARTPDATALVWGTERLSYRELDTRAGRLARRLR
ncbi:MAG: amino acid adenylation domain-containing protein, partial [Thermoanaerobaculia bacterium]